MDRWECCPIAATRRARMGNITIALAVFPGAIDGACVYSISSLFCSDQFALHYHVSSFFRAVLLSFPCASASAGWHVTFSSQRSFRLISARLTILLIGHLRYDITSCNVPSTTIIRIQCKSTHHSHLHTRK